MNKQAKKPVGVRSLAIWMAAASMLLFFAVSVVRAGDATDGGRAIPVPPVPTRISPVNRAKQRLAEERAMVHALAGKRDPFKLPPPPKIGGGPGGVHGPLPPGVRGLVIGQLSLKGIVREDASHTMIAVVMNGTNLAYFLHVHQEVYNGVVTKITPDAIYFLEKSPGAGGRSEAREVVLKLGSTR